MKPFQETIHALKEWSVAVQALEAGETILLLRKGGIREVKNCFQVEHSRVLLYPTYEHQKPHLLKEKYTSQVNLVPSGWHPETVQIKSWAEIVIILRTSAQLEVDRVLPYHIWNEKFVRDRLKWKPKQPLYLLLLRTYLLPETIEIPYRSEYGGCRSWIDLTEPISLQNSVPALTQAEFDRAVRAIHTLQ